VGRDPRGRGGGGGVEVSGDDSTECEFGGTRPEAGSEVKPGDTIVVIKVCDGEPPENGGGSSEEPTEGNQ
jgi:hypothetical protein